MDIKLWNDPVPYYNEEADTPNLMRTFFLETDKSLPCVVVVAGGSYRGRAKHEDDPIAQFFNARGFHAAVVDYRVAPNRFPAGLSDLQRAIRILRYHAEEWLIDPERIVVCGFSAGGHLAASSIVRQEIYGAANDAIDEMPHVPNGAILCYPVISVDADFGHVGSGNYLLGEDASAEERAEQCLHKKVTDQTPTAFLWHTSDDEGVNVKNSLAFASALRDHDIPFEMHVFPNGHHGLGLASDRPDVSKWAYLAAEWIERCV